MIIRKWIPKLKKKPTKKPTSNLTKKSTKLNKNTFPKVTNLPKTRQKDN